MDVTSDAKSNKITLLLRIISLSQKNQIMNFCHYRVLLFIVLVFVRSNSLKKSFFSLDVSFFGTINLKKLLNIESFVIFFLKCPVFFGRSSQTSSGSTLRLVIVITRHGDRTPTSTFGNYSSCKLQYGDECGQLTGEGMRQLFQLGQLLRSLHFITSQHLSVEEHYTIRMITT